MIQDDNFFAFHDLTPQAGFLWSSPSITSCLGYEPDEVIGLCPWAWIHPADLAACQETHKENVLNEIVGTQMSFRMRRKDGTYLPCVVFGCFCYQYIVSCYTFTTETDGAARKFTARGAHSAAMTNIVGSVREEFERISRHHKAFDANSWNPAGLDLEIRACLLLNRFTRHLAVMYASPSCELIFNIDPDDLLGKPLLLFIRADDLASFVDQSDQARISPAVRHLRFWFQSPNCRYEIPCEAMLYGASDAMIMILRKCLPFRRKRFLTDYADPECVSVASSYRASSFGGSFNQKYSRSEDSGFGGSGLHSIRGHSNRDYSSPPAYGGSVNSMSSSISSSSEYSSGTRAYKASLRNIPVGSINSIRNLDGDHQRVRPLTSLRSNVDLAAELEVLPKLRELHTEDSEVIEDESELDIAVGRINLNDLSAIPVPERFIEEDSDEYMEFSDEEEDYYYRERNYYEEEVEMPSSMRRY